jgi:transketolase
LDNPFNYSAQDIAIKAYKIRVDIIRALAEAGSGHSGGPLGFADVLATIFFSAAGIDPHNPTHPDRDRIVFSAGHYSPLIYSTLAHAGYFSVDHLIKNYRQYNGRLDGHPNLHTPGIENASGPLGQGVSQAAGMAAAGWLDKKNYRVWLMMSDGEQQEGQTQEALMWLGSRKLDNIIAFIDVNNMQIDGPVSDILPETWLKDNYTNYGWRVFSVNGHSIPDLIKTISIAKSVKGRPVLILAKTTPGKGVSFMENDYHWHGKPPKGDEVNRALSDLHKIGHRLGVSYV